MCEHAINTGEPDSKGLELGLMGASRIVVIFISPTIAHHSL